MLRLLGLIAASIVGCVACAFIVSFGYVLQDGGPPKTWAELQAIVAIVDDVAIRVAFSLGFVPGLLALYFVRDVCSEWKALPIFVLCASLGVLLGEGTVGPIGYVLGGIAGLAVGVTAIRQFQRIRRQN